MKKTSNYYRKVTNSKSKSIWIPLPEVLHNAGRSVIYFNESSHTNAVTSKCFCLESLKN